MSKPAIHANAMHFQFNTDEPELFSDFQVSVATGSIYGLLGPNGCGKTTFLKLLLGQAKPSAGELQILGLDPWIQAQETRSRVGLVPQENDLDPKLTVDQTLELFAGSYGERWNGEQAEAKIERFGLDSFRNHAVGELSGGLRQRLSLITVIAAEPEILLLDEPTTGLDAVARQDFAETIIEFSAQDPDHTVVITSHLLSEIEPLVDHVGMLPSYEQRGRMFVECSLTDLKEKIQVAEIPLKRERDPEKAVAAAESQLEALFTEDPALSFQEQSDREQLMEQLRPKLTARVMVSWGIPENLRNLPTLLSISGDEPTTFVFWNDMADDREQVTLQVEQEGGRILDSWSLDEIFVRLFRSSAPISNRRVVDGVLLND